MPQCRDRGRSRRRALLALSRGALAGTLLVGLAACGGTDRAGGTPGGASTRAPDIVATGPVPVPTTGAYLGMHFPAAPEPASGAGRGPAGGLPGLERALGRRLAIDHVYHRFDEPFPDGYDRRTIRAGRLLFLSWSCRLEGTGAVDWSQVARGRWDDVIDARARSVAALGRPVLMSLCHEPGGAATGAGGRPDEYVDAWRHVVRRFRADGTTNVSWVWTLTAHSFRAGDPAAYYPGDDVVDWVGVDGYANVQCPWLDVPWTSWYDVFGAADDFAARHRKPLVVAEFSLREDPGDPGRKGRWLADALADIRAMPQLRAVVGFNSDASCSSYVVSSPQALAGFRVLADDPYLSPAPGAP